MSNMAHHLNWTPGNYGRGLVAPSGDIHTWNTDEEGERPYHSDYIEDNLGYDDREGCYRGEHETFEIDPNGLHDGPDGLENLDPRLKAKPTARSWNFQASTPIKVVPIEHGGQDGQYNTVPFVYDPAERTVYTGKRGGYHNNLFEAMGRDDWNLPQGKLHPPYTEENQYTGEVEEHPEELQWFGKPPEEHEEIHQALGVPPLSGKWAWAFQRKAHQLGWQPGQWGKGLVHGDDVHTWDTGVYDGQPIHPQYAEQNFGASPHQWFDGKDFSTAFQIHPDGKIRFWDPVDNDLRDLVQSTHPHFDTYASPFDSAWNFQSRVAMPVGEDYWKGWQKEPDNALYHGTSPKHLESIMQHGLHPWDSNIAGGTNYDFNNWLQPRPGHVYLSQKPRDAWDRGLSSVEHERPIPNPLVFKVDPNYLDPQHINPDEDDMLSKGDQDDSFGSLGEMAEQMNYGIPSETQRQIARGKHIGYRGVIPPEALIPGHYNEGTWQPIEWPRIASLIDMRDGWGRFAVAAPWEFGQYGKGIYFPETGVLQTWNQDDGRTHLDVWNEDDNFSQPGATHHLIIRPNGTVRDQGSFDRNMNDVVGDREGLQRALRELDPRLKVDKSESWTFDMNGPGPTEPTEEEPSTSRGEQGDMNHGVQVSNDYAGSL